MKSNFIKRKLVLGFCSAFLLLPATATVAATSGADISKSVFYITSKIYVDGKLVSSPRIITKANTDARITIANKDRKNTLDIRLIANDFKGNAIKIKYDVLLQEQNARIGGKQEVVVTPNQEKTLNLATSFGHTYEMRVLAKRK